MKKPTPPKGRKLKEGQEPIKPISVEDYCKITTEGVRSIKEICSQPTKAIAKVYCLNCKNLDENDYIRCNWIIGAYDTPFKRKAQYAEYERDNKNNNCEYYIDKNEKDEIDYDYKFFGLIKCKRK